MSKVKSNAGATLVELLVSIVVGSLVTVAAITVFIFGLQAHKLGTETGIRQNQIQMGMSVIQELLTENEIVRIGENGEIFKFEESAENQEKLLVYYDADADAVCGVTGAKILENVSAYSVTRDAENSPSLITVTVKVKDARECKLTVYCRFMNIPPETTEGESNGEDADADNQEAPAQGSSPEPMVLRDGLSGEEILAEVLSDVTLRPSVRVFLNKLGSQLGSTGRIQTESGEGDYYSQWYIGSFQENPDWNADTPWCACYVSWALEACSPFLEGTPARFANVDKFWVELVTTDAWKQENPQAGDLIFFDWIVDEEYNPQHVGVVLAQSNGWVYTIEGNANGVVAVRRYATEDAQILGYGILDWK